MPRPKRQAPAGAALHVVNRTADKRQVFFEPSDYERFIELLAEARTYTRVRVHAYCVMPNHFHLLVVGLEPNAVSACMQRLTGGHSRQVRRNTASRGSGHVYGGRFWCDIIRTDHDFLAVQGYIEANPLRAKLVARAELWQWSSLWERETGRRMVLDPSPVALPADWIATVNAAKGSDPSAPLARGQTPASGQTLPRGRLP